MKSHTTSSYLGKLNKLLAKGRQLRKTYNVYRKISLQRLTALGQYASVRSTFRNDFYSFPIRSNARYVMVSRTDENGQIPNFPLTNADFKGLIDFEAYKLSVSGVKKADRTAVVDFTQYHTIPLSLAFMQLGTIYFVLEGEENRLFYNIVQKKISVIFTNPHFLKRFIMYIKNNHLITSLRIVLTAGDMIFDPKKLTWEKKKNFWAQIVDKIRTKEL